MSRPGLCALALSAGTLVLGGCDEDLINPMAARQPRVNFYSASDFYENGVAMRQPPAGTVPRSRATLNPALTAGKTVSATGEEYVASIPVKVDMELLELGRRRYNIVCATCHGPVGDGDSLVARQMALRPPPSLHLYAERPPGYIFEVITRGFGLMASFAAELPVHERWAVVAYVRALQLSQATPIEKAPPEERERLEKEAR